MKSEHLKHLYWRAGFGIHPYQLHVFSKKDTLDVVDYLFKTSKKYIPLNIDVSEFKTLNPKMLKANPKLVRELRKKSRKKILDLNIAWIERFTNSEAILRERMTLFWANHFVCKDQNVVYTQQYNHTLRTHALGNFKEFVKAISKEAAMIRYLNLKQNRKAQPNENFARELMELFTLGTGNYTENDIKESARAFTGYNHKFDGSFRFRAYQHDNGEKQFLGQHGNFNGDDIIDIILKKRQCAKFICEKIYRYFVNEIINDEDVEAMTTVFFKDYDIENLMRFVFTQDWFYDKKNIGAKIKSPIDVLVGISKTVPFALKNKRVLIRLQKLLGQTLFNPPNVAGWKGHKAWIDANTIMVRLKLPSLLLNHGLIALEDGYDQMRQQKFKKNKSKLPIKAEPNWTAFEKQYKAISTEKLSTILLNGQLNKGTVSYLETLSKNNKKEYCIQLMSLPEYQMC